MNESLHRRSKSTEMRSDGILHVGEIGKRTVDTCQLSLVGDSWWFQIGCGSSLYTSVNNMAQAIMGANTIYRRDVGSGFQILSIAVYTNPATDPFYTPASSDIYTLLSTLDLEKVNIPPTNRCLIHLFTWNDYSGIIGLGNEDVLCESSGGSAVTTGLSFGAPLASVTVAQTAAHVTFFFLSKLN